VTSGAVVHAGQRYRLALLATHAQGGRKEMVFGGSALQGGVKNLPIDIWLVVWNIDFIFPYIENNNPN